MFKNLISNPFDLSSEPPREPIDLLQVIQHQKLFTDSELSTIRNSIILGRLAGKDLLFGSGENWYEWGEDELSMWLRFANYKSIITHNYHYESKSKKEHKPLNPFKAMSSEQVQQAEQTDKELRNYRKAWKQQQINNGK